MTGSDPASSIRIRPATEADFDAIVDVWQKSGLPYRPMGRDRRDEFARQLPHYRNMYLVAADGDLVVGVIMGTHDHRKGWINRLAVLPDYRRRGIAAKLLSECETAIHAHGIEIISILIEGDNCLSADFFESMGYREYAPIRYFRKLARPGV